LRAKIGHEEKQRHGGLFLFWFGAIGFVALFCVFAGADFVFSESEAADYYGGEHDDEYGNDFFHVWPLCD
jgi:hypothetical protein